MMIPMTSLQLAYIGRSPYKQEVLHYLPKNVKP